MSHTRIKLSWLMAGVGYCALGIAAMRYPTIFLMNVIYTGAVTLVAVAAIAAWVDERRVFCKGAAVLGFAYLLFSNMDPTGSSTFILTGRLFDILFDYWVRNFQSQALSSQRPYNPNFPWRGMWFEINPSVVRVAFFGTGHGLATVAHAVVGGWIALWIDSKKKRVEPPRPNSDQE